MKYLSKISIALFCFLSTISALPAYTYSDTDIWGDYCYCDIPDVRPTCWFDVGAYLIYWKPCVDNLNYGVKYKTESNSKHIYKYQDICPGFEAGVRTEISRDDLFCGWGLSGSYTFLYSEDKTKTDTVIDGVTSDDDEEDPYTRYSTLLLPGIFTDPWDSVSGKYSLRYHGWDFLLTHKIDYYRCHIFTPFLGVSGAVFDQQVKSKLKVYEENSDGRKTSTIQDKGLVTWDSDLIGVGLKVGTEYLFRLDRSLSIFTKASCEILAGNPDTLNFQKLELDVQEDGPIEIYRFRDPDSCILINGYHFQLGLIYNHDIFGCGSVVRAGYEFVKYTNLPNPRRFINDQDNEEFNLMTRSPSINTTTLGFHGFFMGIDFKF